MGRTNHSYNGMLSAIARKSLPRFTNYAKDTASLSTIFGNEYSTINKRGNDSLTNIISADFDTPEEYIKETNVGPIITLNGDRTVTMIAEEDYADLGATADGGETVTVDTSNLDTNAVGTYTVSYSATETRDNVDYTRVENRFVKVVAPISAGISWTLKDTISDPSGLNAGFAYDGSASISGDGAWISIGNPDFTFGTDGNVFMYSKNTDITYSKTQDIANPNNSTYYFGRKTKLSRDGNYLCLVKEEDGSISYFQMFKRTNNTWNSIASSIQFSTSVRDVTLSEDATYIVISNNKIVDEVKVYKKSADDTSVTLMTYINPPENSISGARSVSISDNGELLCFGTPSVESNTGNVYVYTRTSSSWSTNPTAVIQGPETGGYFGYGVSMSGDGNFIAVGALGSDRVYIYKRSGTSWSLSSTINGPSGYGFGTSVSLSQYGDYLAVGSFYASGSFTGDHVWAYYKDDTDVWTLVQTFTGDTGTNFGLDVNISSGGNYILVTADQATANAYVYFGAGGEWVPGYTTVSVTLGDKLQPNMSSLTRGQKYVFDFSQTRGKDFRLSLDGTTELTSGVIEAENTLVYTLLSYFPFPQLYYYSPNTPGIGGSFSVLGTLDDGVIYFDGNGNLRATNITSLTRDVSNVFYFSSEYGTKIALSTSLDGANLIDGITSTDTELTVTLPLYYPFSTIFLKSLDTQNIGSPLSVLGTLGDGAIYFDNGTLKATNITSLTRDVSNVFYFSSEYGTKIALSTSLDGAILTDGITSTDTSLTITLPLYYPYNTIFLKSLNTSEIGSSLSVPETTGTIYFDGDGNLRATNITSLTRDVSNVFYFSSDYGTEIALSTSLDGANLIDGITSTDTELTVTLPLYYPFSTIFLKSLDTQNIGSPLSVLGTLGDGAIYFDNGTLKATNITSLTRDVSNVFYFSSEYGTKIALSTSLDGAILTDGITSTDTSLTITLPLYYPYNTIFLKSLNTSEIGSSLSVPETTGTIYFDGDGNLRATNITTLTRGVSNVFYFSSNYGTKIALSTSLNGPNLTDGITSTDTELTVTLPLAYPYSTIFLKSIDTLNIGSELSVPGSLNDGVIYYDGDGNLRATNITTLYRGVSNVFHFSSDYGTSVALSTSLNGANLTEGISNTETSLTVVVPWSFPETIFLKSIDTLNIGSELSVPFPSPVQTSIPTSNPSNLDSNSAETFRSIITGLYAHNDTRQIGSYTFDNRGTTGQDSDTIISYPDLIVQALPGDTITITANVVLPISSSFVSVELWYWYGSGDWIEFHSEQVSSAGYTDVTGELTIPSNKFGNFAIAASTAWNSDYEWNIRKYSLHVIDPDYYL